MAVIQGMEQTVAETGPAVPQPGHKNTLSSYMWKGKPEKFLKGEPKILGVSHFGIWEKIGGGINLELIQRSATLSH